MAALSQEYIEILERELLARYVPNLPPLLPVKGQVQPADKQINRALSAFAINALLGVSADVAAKSVIDDFGDQGIDAIYYDSTSETLHLIQAKFKPDDFKEAEAQTFCAGVRLLIRQEFGVFNQNVINRQLEIESALSEAAKIELWVVCTGGAITGTATTAFQNFINDETHGETARLVPQIRHVDPDHISQELRKRNSYKPVDAQLFLMHDACVKEPRLTWFGMMQLKDLVDLHVKEDKALYDKNVRYFLGTSKSDVNKAIQNTLEKEPKTFFYLNNGITALCSSIDPKDKKANRRRLKVRGLSIINGAQTVASAAELMARPNPPDIADARVMVTLIQANADGKFGPEVTKARNSQNIVQAASFASQDPNQDRLAQELLALGINYHVRQDVAAVPSDTSILFTEAVYAQAWTTLDPRYPVWAKSGKGDLTNRESAAYKALFTSELAGAHLANAVCFYREIHKIIAMADRAAVGKERLVYRHGLHAIGWTYFKRLRKHIRVAQPITPDAARRLISVSFDEHRQLAVDRFSSLFLGPLAFFKNQSYTTPYLMDLMEHALGLVGHAALADLKHPHPQEAFAHERLFLFMSQQAPQI